MVNEIVLKNASKVVIVGTGFGGIATAYKLKEAGIRDFVILERAASAGGVWRDNHYPGAACDVQSHLYSFSFAPNPNWTQEFSPQAEIYQYLQDCVVKLGLLPHIRFNHSVTKMVWDKTANQWLIETSQGNFSAQFVVGAFGVLSDPELPAIEGMDTFKGERFHSSTWPKNFSLKGKRVAVLGTGASAIQFVPAIQPDVAHMTVFQRTAPWVMPRHDGLITAETKRLYRRFPLLEKAERLKLYAEREALAVGFKAPAIMKLAQRKAIQHIHSAIKDPELRRKVTPNYVMGCKRILLSNTYYPALAQPNVAVVTASVKQVTEQALIDENGQSHQVDVIIYGTGFAVNNLPFSHFTYGASGLTLSEVWAGSPHIYLGTTVHDFPTLFLLHGPNVGLGHSSVVYMLEVQADHIATVIKAAQAKNAVQVQPSLAAQDEYTHWLDKVSKNTVWSAGGCKSWYLDATGRNSNVWPSFTFSYRYLANKTKISGYHFD
jgi:cation diffusion facilitator CzcD-associated flavoprotein CzcO